MSEADHSWLRLEDDEEVVWSGQPRLLGHAGTLLAGVVLTPVLGVGLALIAWTYLRVQHTTYAITTDRVVRKTGILSRTVTDLGHGKIQDTSYHQSLVGRYYDFGTVDVSTAGGSDVELRFSHVSDPLAVQERLDEVARAGRGPGSDGVGGPVVDGSSPGASDTGRAGGTGGRSQERGVEGTASSELVAELRGTREALEAIERHIEERRRGE